MSRVILGLMIGDEDPELVRRAVQSARASVDAVVVQYNGTQHEDPHAAFGLDGSVVQCVPWSSFGGNRMQLFSACQVFASDVGWPLGETYMLTLDADQIFHGLVPPDLEAPGYSVPFVTHAGTRFRRPVLLRLDVPWVCSYPTHEAWEGAEHAHLPGQAMIEDTDEGTLRADKYERDERLIRAYLEDHPTDARMLFYLGHTLWARAWLDRNNDELVQAALVANLVRAYYPKGWDQERVVALLHAAELSSTPEGIEEFARQALELDCTRAEAWLLRAHLARMNGDWAKVHEYATYATECVPREDGLFVDLRAHSDKAQALILEAVGQTGDA